MRSAGPRRRSAPSMSLERASRRRSDAGWRMNIGRSTKTPSTSATMPRTNVWISCIRFSSEVANMLAWATSPCSMACSNGIERRVMTSPRASLKPTAEATSSRSEASSSSGRACQLVFPAASVTSTPSTRTATVRRLTPPGARTTSRVVSETSKFVRSRVSVTRLCDCPPLAASPSGRLEATVTAPGRLSSEVSERSSVSTEMASRLSGSKRRSVIASRSETVSSATSTTALP